MIAVVTWKWSTLFSALYVNRMRAMLARHLHLPHRVYCFTDDASGIDRDVICLPLPREFANTPRCRRRMAQYNREVDSTLGRRLLSIDLDCVVTNDMTSLVDGPEAVVMWRVAHAGVFSGSFVQWDAGALHGAYAAYAADPNYPTRGGERHGSDQAALNLWLKQSRAPVKALTEADGIVTYYGQGYESREHLGVGPNRQTLPAGTRLVVLGSADKSAMDSGAHPWIVEHWR